MNNYIASIKVKYKILILLFELSFGITINFIGYISVSEIFLFFTVFHAFSGKLFTEMRELSKVRNLYIYLFIFQVISSIFVNNTVPNIAKGLAITIVSYLHFIFLLKYFKKSKTLVIYALIGMLLRSIIFGSKFEGTLNGALSGEDSAYLKFYIAPFISTLVLLISFYLSKKNIGLISLILGLFLIVIGARSSGGFIFIVGLIVIFLNNISKLSKRRMITLWSVLVIISYGIYCVYINAILDGKITSGNSQQIFKSSQPYNPINLFKVGRSETFVGFYAFLEKPIFGHGSWAIDRGYRYHYLLGTVSNENYNYEYNDNVIPCHSIIIGEGMENGIGAFIMGILIFLLFTTKGVKSISSIKNTKYIYILIYSIVSIIWIGLFSPMSEFRLEIPFYFSIIFMLYNNHKGYQHKLINKI